RGDGAVARPHHGSRLGLRDRAGVQLTRGLHRLPATQDRSRWRAAPHPYRPWHRLRVEGSVVKRTRIGGWWSDLPLRNRLAVVAAVPVALAIGVAVTVAYVETRHELRGQI